MASLGTVFDGSGKVYRLNSEIPEHVKYARLSFEERVLENELEAHEKRFNPCDFENHHAKRRELMSKVNAIRLASRNALGECFEEYRERETE